MRAVRSWDYNPLPDEKYFKRARGGEVRWEDMRSIRASKTYPHTSILLSAIRRSLQARSWIDPSTVASDKTERTVRRYIERKMILS